MSKVGVTTPPFVESALQALVASLSSEVGGWQTAGSPALAGVKLRHPSGRESILRLVVAATELRKSDVTQELRELSQSLRGAGRLLLLYSHAGYHAGAELAALNREANPAILLAPTEKDERYRVDVFASSGTASAEDLDLANLCASAIERAVFGTVSCEHGGIGFESFSLDPRRIQAITFLAERECGRRRFELIRGAQRSILLATYNFGDPQLAEILVEKARHLPVKCILSDAKGLRDNPRIAGDLRKGGVDVVLSKSHAKCLVVDRLRVVIGSANASQAVVQGLEFNIEVNSDELAEKLTLFLEDRLRRAAELEGAI